MGSLSYLSSLRARTDDDDLPILFLLSHGLQRCSSSCFHHKMYLANPSVFLPRFLAVLPTFIKLLLPSPHSLLFPALTIHVNIPVLEGVLLSSSCPDVQLPIPAQCTRWVRGKGGTGALLFGGTLLMNTGSPHLAPSLHPHLFFRGAAKTGQPVHLAPSSCGDQQVSQGCSSHCSALKGWQSPGEPCRGQAALLAGLSLPAHLQNKRPAAR